MSCCGEGIREESETGCVYAGMDFCVLGKASGAGVMVSADVERENVGGGRGFFCVHLPQDCATYWRLDSGQYQGL